ncbi:MAG: hypothetical protein DRQ98_03595 [Gammaproteobacteria bacterium]|nr:MAG: hypothetical protein DRQ98_03595 [Gammaproteobacteria bacterium]
MPEETKTVTATKAAPKRKPATKRKPVTKRKPAAAKRKPVTKRATRKSTPDFSTRAQEAGRNAFLASLGFYGKAFDQAQERRKKADKMYKELVKRGKKVEKNAKGRIEDIELPKLELNSLTDRKKLEKQLDKAKARFEELKETVGFKAAA